jgi:dUTP pyrophosphatase
VTELPVRRIDTHAELPSYARSGDAGADLVAKEDVLLRAAGGRALVKTGVAIAIPEGHAGFILPRSGLALTHGVTLVNAPGLIDAGYRDELMVLMINTDPTDDYQVHRGDRVAQLVVQRVEHVTVVEVDDLPSPVEDAHGRPVRGTGGFGHTGR